MYYPAKKLTIGSYRHNVLLVLNNILTSNNEKYLVQITSFFGKVRISRNAVNRVS